MFLYRVENLKTQQGLWYRADGTYNAYIKTLGDALCHDLPMDFDPEFKKGGEWLSACDNTKDMSNWFSLSDLTKLHHQGYGLYRIGVTSYRSLNGHAVFLRENEISSEEVSMSVICKDWPVY